MDICVFVSVREREKHAGFFRRFARKSSWKVVASIFHKNIQ